MKLNLLPQSQGYFRLKILGGLLLWTLTACAPGQALVTVESPPTPTLQPPAVTSAPLGPEPTQTAVPATPTLEVDSIPRPMLGVETHNLNLDDRLDLIRQSGANLVRYNGLQWSQVEPIEGQRNWEAVAELEAGLAKAAEQGLEVILIVRSAPPWAQAVEGSYCGPVKVDKLPAMANFMADVVVRYSAPPFEVKYVELGNEPDVQPSFVRPTSVFGCWGDGDDEFYGGGYYAEMLKHVYPAIKAADPEAQVLIGGLLLDCDPTNPPEGRDCKPAKFLEGILRNGGGDYFDIVSYHGYPQYYLFPFDGSGLYADEHFPSWDLRGGVVLGKADFLREVMANYGLEKPIMHTEGSLICPERNTESCTPPGEDFFEAQAEYVVWLYIRNWAAGLEGTVWYKFEGPGWRYGAMLDENQQPKPAYRAFQFLSQEMADMAYRGEVALGENLRVYEFSGPDKKIWVAWSVNDQSYEISLPPGWSAVYDKYGNPLAPAESGVLAINSPVYIEIAP